MIIRFEKLQAALKDIGTHTYKEVDNVGFRVVVGTVNFGSTDLLSLSVRLVSTAAYVVKGPRPCVHDGWTRSTEHSMRLKRQVLTIYYG